MVKARGGRQPLVQKTGKLLDLIGLREIIDDCLCLAEPSARHGRVYKAVLQVDPTNFALKSDAEQESILAGYRVLIQSIAPGDEISIHIRILPYNLQAYLSHLEEAKHHASPLLHDLASDHEAFVLSLASEQTPLQREFYIRVMARASGMRGRRAESFQHAKTDLQLQCEALLQNLERAGLTAHRLDSAELVRYYEACLQMHHGEQQPLSQDVLYSVDFPNQVVPSASSFSLQEQELDAIPLVSSEEEDPSVIVRKGLESHKEGPQEAKSERIKPWWVWERKERLQKREQRARRRQEQTGGSLPYSLLVSLPELLEPSLIQQTPQWIKITHEHDEYFRGRSLIGYPAYMNPGWLDRLIQIDEPYTDLVIYLTTLDAQKYTNLLSRRITAHTATLNVAQAQGSNENPYVLAAYEEASNLREKVVRQEELVHGISIYIGVRATSLKELRERDDKLVLVLRALELESVSCSLEHLQAWLSMLPDAQDVLKRRRVLDTSCVSYGFPFGSSALSTEPGSLVGIMPNGGLVIMNPTSPELENGHEVTFARSGAGKSYYNKVTLMRLLLLGFKGIVIDPEDEWKDMCERFGGSNVRLSPGALMLNPFDLVPVMDTSDRDLLTEKIESLLILFDLLLADTDDGGMLSQKEKSYLRKCLRAVYQDRGMSSDPATHRRVPPNMQELYFIIISEQCGPDKYELGDRLLGYLPSFPAQTQVALDLPLVVFNIRDLPDTNLRPAALFLITDFVWTQIRKERFPQRRLLVIDEAWKLMEFPEGGKFVAALSRRARKYNLALRIITQDVGDFLASPWGRTVLMNSAQKFLMKQDSTTIDAVAQAFKLSEEEQLYLQGAAKGEGLFFAKNSHVPIRIVASELEHEVATTNQEELLQREVRTREVEREQNEDEQNYATLPLVEVVEDMVSSSQEDREADAFLL